MKIGSGPQPFDDLTTEIEADERFTLGQSTRAELAVTGEPYTELTADAPRLDEGMALVAGFGVFDAYTRRRNGTLYWHTKPTIERVRQGRNWGYRVHMRLLISDNPVVSRIAAETLRDEGEERRDGPT